MGVIAGRGPEIAKPPQRLGVKILTSIKAATMRPGKSYPLNRSRKGGAVMSQVDILYLAVVLLAFGGFAVVLAYYSRH